MGKFQLQSWVTGKAPGGFGMIYPDSLNGLSGSEIKVYVALAGSLSDKRTMAVMADEPLGKAVGLKRERFNAAKQSLIKRGLIKDCGVTRYGSRVYKVYGIKNEIGIVSDEEWADAVRIGQSDERDVQSLEKSGQNGSSFDQDGTSRGQNVQDSGQNVQDIGQNGSSFDQDGTSRGQNVQNPGQNVQDIGQNGNTYRQETRDKRRETAKKISLSPVPGSAKVKETGREVIKEMVSKNQNWKNSELSHADKMLTLMNGDTEGLRNICRSVTSGNEYYSNFKEDLEKMVKEYISKKNLSIGSEIRESIESFDYSGIDMHADIDDEYQKKIYGYVSVRCGPEVKKMLDDSLNGLLHKFDSEPVVNYIIQNA